MRTFYSRNPKFMRHMWNTLVQPHVDYCSQLWSPSEGMELEKIENLLKSYTAKIPSVKHLNYWDRLTSLRMNSEQRRLERYKIIYTWKILERLVPNCGIIEVNESTRLGRICILPNLVGKTNTRKLRCNSFQYTGPKLFNALPKIIRNLTNMGIQDFKVHLDKYLSVIPDQPKIATMMPICLTASAKPSNSLIDWIPVLSRESRWRTPGA